MPVPFILEGQWIRSEHRIPVTVYDRLGRAVDLLPGSAANTAVMGTRPTRTVVFDPAEVIADPAIKHLIILRPGELGDLIALMAGIRAFKKFFPQIRVTVCAHPKYTVLRDLAPDIAWVFGSSIKRSAPDVMSIDLTGFFELDHHPGAVRVNRVERFLAIFGIYHGQ